MKQYKFSQLPYEPNDYGSLQEKINTCTDQFYAEAAQKETVEEEQRQVLGVDKMMVYDLGVRFADGNARPAGDAAYLTEASKAMYDALSPAFGEFFRGMVETESLDVAVFTHEIGHSWQAQLTSQHVQTSILENMSLDAVEIPSKTMELFTYPYAENFFGKDADKFRQEYSMILQAHENPTRSCALPAAAAAIRTPWHRQGWNRPMQKAA